MSEDKFTLKVYRDERQRITFSIDSPTCKMAGGMGPNDAKAAIAEIVERLEDYLAATQPERAA